MTTTQLDRQVNDLKQEIRALKSWSQKLAQQLRTIEYIVPVEFTLVRQSGGGLSLHASQSAIVTITTDDGKVPLIGYYIDKTDNERRRFFYQGGYFGNNEFKYELYIQSTDNPNDDVGTKLNYNLVFVSTNLLNISVEYRDM